MTIIETIRRTVPNNDDGRLYIKKWSEKYDEDCQPYKVTETTAGITIEVSRWMELGQCVMKQAQG